MQVITLNSAADLTVDTKKKIQQQELDELIINYSLQSDGDVITDSPFAFLKSLKEIKFKITIGENCKSLEKLFFGCTSLEIAPELNLEHVENLNWMFENCHALHSVPSYKTDCATTLVGMFKNCRALTAIPPLVVKKEAKLLCITQGCKSLFEIPHLKDPKIILDSPNDVTDIVRLRVAALDLEEIEINFNVTRKMLFGQFTESNSPFSGILSLTKIPFKITIGNNCHSLEGLFYGCANLEELPFMETSRVNNFNSLCYECISLKTIPMLDTSNVTSFQNTFHGCKVLTHMPLWDTANATNMFGMFEGCSSLEDLPHLNTQNVTKMNWFVSGCENLTALPHLDTKNVEEMSFFVNKCSKLSELPKLNISKVKDPDKIFLGFSNQDLTKKFFGICKIRLWKHFFKKKFSRRSKIK